MNVTISVLLQKLPYLYFNNVINYLLTFVLTKDKTLACSVLKEYR